MFRNWQQTLDPDQSGRGRFSLCFDLCISNNNKPEEYSQKKNCVSKNTTITFNKWRGTCVKEMRRNIPYLYHWKAGVIVYTYVYCALSIAIRYHVILLRAEVSRIASISRLFIHFIMYLRIDASVVHIVFVYSVTNKEDLKGAHKLFFTKEFKFIWVQFFFKFYWVRYWILWTNQTFFIKIKKYRI